MKIFTDRMTRWVTIALLVHGILSFLIGILVFAESLNYLKHPWGTPAWRIMPPLGGSVVAIVVGAVITLLCAGRLKKPFDGLISKRVLQNFKTLFVAEAFVVFFIGSMILDGGELRWRMLLGSLSLNLLLLGIFGGRSNSGA
jgi:hypothetical protein